MVGGLIGYVCPLKKVPYHHRLCEEHIMKGGEDQSVNFELDEARYFDPTHTTIGDVKGHVSPAENRHGNSHEVYLPSLDALLVVYSSHFSRLTD